jgi:hypothetical protein
LSQLAPIADYPLQAAEEAWQYFLDNGPDFNRVSFSTYPGAGFALPEPYIDPYAGQYKYWERTYNEGDLVTIYVWPVVYQPVAGTTAPRILIDRYELQGNESELQAVAGNVGQQIKVVGAYREENGVRILDLVSWEPIEESQWENRQGTIQRSGDQVLFTADETNETFLIPNAPADIVDGERVYLNGWSIEPGVGRYDVFNWQGMDRIVDIQAIEEPIADTSMPVDQPYQINQVTIDMIDLIYIFTPVWDNETQLATYYLQPAWRFQGATDTNENIDIFVQAVPSEYVEQPQLMR